jgi:hypothetical protein
MLLATREEGADGAWVDACGDGEGALRVGAEALVGHG